MGAIVVTGATVGADVVGATVVSGVDVVVESETELVVVVGSTDDVGVTTGVLTAQALKTTAQAPTRALTRVMQQF
ncbi:MAG: hypothetical protein AAB088_00735 [Actinomycetota bacterium]